MIMPDYAPLRIGIQQEDHTYCLRTLLKQGKHIVVQGARGSGKTTFLRWATMSLNARRHAMDESLRLPDEGALPRGTWYPLYCNAHLLHHVPFTNERDFFASSLTQALVPPTLIAKQLDIVDQSLAEQRLLVLIDGVDLVRTEQAQDTLLRVLEILSVKGIVTVLTCFVEPSWLRKALGGTVGYCESVLLGLTPDAVEQFVINWYQRKFDNDPSEKHLAQRGEALLVCFKRDQHLAAMCRVPLHLVATVLTHGRNTPEPALDDYYLAIAESHWVREPMTYPLSPDEVLPQLRVVADLTANKDNAILGRELIHALEVFRSRHPHVGAFSRRSVSDFLTLMQQVGLLATWERQAKPTESTMVCFADSVRPLADWLRQQKPSAFVSA